MPVHRRDFALERHEEEAPTTPGMKYRHYVPGVPVTLPARRVVASAFFRDEAGCGSSGRSWPRGVRRVAVVGACAVGGGTVAHAFALREHGARQGGSTPVRGLAQS